MAESLEHPTESTLTTPRLCLLVSPAEPCPCATTTPRPIPVPPGLCSRCQGWLAAAVNLWDVPSGVGCPLWGGIPGHSPRGQHLSPHPGGVSALFIGGEGPCPLPVALGGTGTPWVPTRPKRSRLRVIFFYFATAPILCVLTNSAVYESVLGLNLLDSGVSWCKGGNPEEIKVSVQTLRPGAVFLPVPRLCHRCCPCWDGGIQHRVPCATTPCLGTEAGG